MYQDFVSILEETGHAPPGLCYRLATAHLESYLQHKKSTHFIFCGFNALSPSEELGVAKIQFDFSGVQQNGGAGYWELDVIGTAIPEPGTCALIGGLLALGSVMIRRRR